MDDVIILKLKVEKEFSLIHPIDSTVIKIPRKYWSCVSSNLVENSQNVAVLTSDVKLYYYYHIE